MGGAEGFQRPLAGGVGGGDFEALISNDGSQAAVGDALGF